ncbi:MAG: TonB-dependent receptor [Alphaproteobacteria bacterium]|nr:TonB-dependent receptor [Alphaproteobacteria bacterium]
MHNPETPRSRGFAAAVWLASASLLGVPVASAQQAATNEGSTANSFEAAYFASFNPVTAEDMVRRVPGFVLNDGETRRGFAATAGNVLINGQRPSSKTPISEQLSRISARDVLRIDLLTGDAEGAGAAGQTQFVDVRLRPRTAAATNTLVVQASQLDPSGSINPLVVVTSAFKAADATVNLALQAQPTRRGRIEYDKVLVTPSGDVIEQGPEMLQGHYWEYKFSGRVGWKATDADSINLNAQVTPSRDGRHTFSEVHGPDGALLRTEDSKVVGDDALATELGGDWEHRLSPNSSVKLIGLGSWKTTGSGERYSANFLDGTSRDTLITRAADSGEYIGRGVFSWRPSNGHSIEVGGELAFNFLDSKLDVRVKTLGLVLDRTPPVADTRVEEQRGEAYASDAWQISSALKLESRITVEASTISQSGDAVQERRFTFVKPRVNATWSPGSLGQFRLLLERDVAQLDFTEFATAVSVFDNIVSLGNPDLEPERTWRIQGEWEKRFGAKGALVLTAFHDQVEQVQDQIPVIIPANPATSTAEQRFDSPGNIGDGTRTGLRLDAMLPLDPLGLPKAELRLKGMVQTTRVTDPTTGQKRRFSDEADWNYSVDFRQPLPRMKLLWGALYEHAGKTETFRLAEIRSLGWDSPHIDFFIETTALQGLVVRFTAADVTLPNEVRNRRFYSPDRQNPANLSSVETRRARGGYGTRSYAIRVSGSF